MIRTWGYGVAGEDQSAGGDNCFAVFQFYRHTLALVVHGGDGDDDGLLARVVVRVVHDAAKEVREDDDAKDALRGMLTAADQQVAALRKKHGLQHSGLAASIFWIGAGQMWFAQTGPTAAYHLRGAKGRRIGDRLGQQLLGGGSGLPVEVAGPARLQPNDVLVLGSLAVADALTASLLAAEDWSMPQRAVRRTLEGLNGATPDNSAIVAVAMNKSPEFIRPTIPPNLTLLLQEMLARHGRDDARAAVFREMVEEVKPEWGKGTFIKEEAVVEREKLVFKEKETEAEEEEDPMSAWEEFLLGFTILRDRVLNAFRTEKGRRQFNVVSAGLAAVFLILLGAGLFLDIDALQESMTAPPPEASPSEFEVREGELTRRADQPRPDPAPSAGEATALGTGPGIKGPADGKEPVRGVSPWRRLFGFLLLGGAAAGALWWRRKRIEDAQAERQRVREEQLRALIERAMVGQGDVAIGQKLLASDGQAGLATLELPGGGRDRLLLVTAPKTLVVEEGDEDLAELTRPGTRVLHPTEIIECTIVQNMGHKENTQGGGRTEWVERLELQLRTADASNAEYRVSLLHMATPPGTLAHFEALAVAHHWEGVVHALRQSYSPKSPRAQLARIRPLIDEGLVSREEFEFIRHSLGRRRSGYLASSRA
ncbi:MAG: hypothetical protein ACI8PZ_003862 [Myxococcota bacterium]|jgi:hypothetical protein